MGIVYEASDDVLGRDVAIKVLHAEVARDERFVARFFDEARIVAQLSSNPHVVSIYDLGRTPDGSPYLVMEYLTGRTLRDTLPKERLASRSWVVDVGKQIAAALIDAHGRGVIHRDLKPENVFVLESHTLPFLLKVLDFGIARSPIALRSGALATQEGVVLGTPRYLAPEVAFGESAKTASDIYALGLILYEAATGRFPYEVRSAMDFVRAHALQAPAPFPSSGRTKEFPETFKTLVMQALSKRPEERPTSANMLRELSRIESEILAMDLGRAQSF